MTENNLVPQISASVLLPDLAAFDKMAKHTGFLASLKVSNGMTKQVQTGLVPVGVMILVKGKSEVKNLGKNTEFLVFTYRYKAVDANNKKVFYDHNSQGFTDVMDRSTIQDSMCFFGPEFLIWIQGEGFATLHAASKSARRECANLKGVILGYANGKLPLVTAKAKFVEFNNKSWWTMEYIPSNSPFTGNVDWDEVAAQITRFHTPKEEVFVEEEEAEERPQ